MKLRILKRCIRERHSVWEEHPSLSEVLTVFVAVLVRIDMIPGSLNATKPSVMIVLRVS